MLHVFGKMQQPGKNMLQLDNQIQLSGHFKKGKLSMSSKKNSRSQKNEKKIKKSGTLVDRTDLYNSWKIKAWFKENHDEKKEYKIHKIFIILFAGLYEDLAGRFKTKKRDDIFKNFINVVFPTVLDVYKWQESEKVKFDIGIIQALEEIATCNWYIELLASYNHQYSVVSNGKK